MSDAIEFWPATHGGTPPSCGGCGANVPADAHAVNLHREWHKRLDAIEARQRVPYHQQHDETCAQEVAFRAYMSRPGPAYAAEVKAARDVSCDCWLSQEPT